MSMKKEKNDLVLSRVDELLSQGKMLETKAMFSTVGTSEYLDIQTWLNQSVLVIHSFLPSTHPFRRQSSAYMSGGGLLGVQGMRALLESLRIEISRGTFG